jgi:circadian clock protein KaiB
MSAKASQRERAPVSPANPGAKGREICLRLYIASTTPNSERAKANLDAALRDFTDLPRFSVEFVDVLADAKRAVTDNVIVTPTLVAIGPKRRLVMIGDLSDSNKLQGLLQAAANGS